MYAEKAYAYTMLKIFDDELTCFNDHFSWFININLAIQGLLSSVSNLWQTPQRIIFLEV